MVFVVLLSITVLRKRYSIIQYLAVTFVVAGLLLVTLFDIENTSDDKSINPQIKAKSSEKHIVIIGMLALLGGQFFHASHAILEEHILTRAAGQEPLYMMGWEGIFGIIFTMLILIPGQMMTCPFDEA